MFRNNSRTQTTTVVGQSNVLGSSNDTFSTLAATRSSQTSIRNNVRNEIMFAILTSNLQEVRRLINSTNSNDIIDNINGYTALHHAVRIRGNDNIIEYLMSVGANPRLKQNENKDAIDLSIESNYRFLIDKLLNKNESELNKIYDKLDNTNFEFKNLKRKNEELVEENTYLKKSSSQYVEKIDKLKSENDNLIIKYENSEKAFANLLKKTKKN